MEERNSMIAGGGGAILMHPGELGIHSSPLPPPPPPPPPPLHNNSKHHHNNNKQSRGASNDNHGPFISRYLQSHPALIKRQQRAIAACLTSKNTSKIASSSSSSQTPQPQVTLVACTNYRGMEVVWIASTSSASTSSSTSTSTSSPTSCLTAVCARTQYILQTLPFGISSSTSSSFQQGHDNGAREEEENKNKVLWISVDTADIADTTDTTINTRIEALVAHPQEGTVACLCTTTTSTANMDNANDDGGGNKNQHDTRNGMVLFVLTPQRENPASGVARYQWHVTVRLDLYPLFYDNNNFPNNRSKPTTSATTTPMSISSSSFPSSLCLSTCRVLVAHSSQVCIVDVSSGELLWTWKFPAPIALAQISGDGEALAISLHDEEEKHKTHAPSPNQQNNKTNRKRELSLSQSNTEEQEIMGGNLDHDGSNHESEKDSRDYDGDDEDYDSGHGVYTFERDSDDGAFTTTSPPPPATSAATTAAATTSDTTIPMEDASNNSQQSTITTTRTSSPGVVYKPSPFLVQTSSVTQLAFRGLGHEVSSITSSGAVVMTSKRKGGGGGRLVMVDGHEQGCDLLLVVAGTTAKIYTQNSWRLLVEWQLLADIPPTVSSSSSVSSVPTASRTRVDFMQTTCAFTLADLESWKKPQQQQRKTATNDATNTTGTNASTTATYNYDNSNNVANSPRASSAPSSRRPSLGDTNNNNNNNDKNNSSYTNVTASAKINETVGKRGGIHHYPSLPSAHTSPLSHAGAWISEVTICENTGKATIRLSRLTYLKRGMDELSPTLFENVSAVLQPNLISSIILPATSATLGEKGSRTNSSSNCNSLFCIQGIWPTWNPWLLGGESATAAASDSANLTETLRGSAMAALGLSSGVGYHGAAAPMYYPPPHYNQHHHHHHQHHHSSPNGGRGTSTSVGGFDRGGWSSTGGMISPLGLVGDPLLASTQIPPTQVRIISSHPLFDIGGSDAGGVSVCEFLVLGDSDWTSLELSNPRRSFWKLDPTTTTPIATAATHTAAVGSASSNTLSTRRSPSCSAVASLDLESSRLVAHVEKTPLSSSTSSNSSNTIQLTWRRHGSCQLLPSNWFEDVDTKTTARLLHENKKWFKDESVLPVPCVLPSYQLHDDRNMDNNNHKTDGTSPPQSADNCDVAALAWWPDPYFGVAPLLLVLTRDGTVRVLEVPPPWLYQEPLTMRNTDWEQLKRRSGGDGDSNDDALDIAQASPLPSSLAGINGHALHQKQQGRQQTYDVLITPHPEYGLGLRLEVKKDGEPAIAGSFKRHPLTGEVLPAEKTGMVVLGDELISANGVDLDDKLFDEIIGTVRDLGAASCGKPMRITFRRRKPVTAHDSSQSSLPPPLPTPPTPPSPSRRTAQEIIGIRTKSTTETKDLPPELPFKTGDPAKSQEKLVEKKISNSLPPEDAHTDTIPPAKPDDSLGGVIATFPQVFPSLPKEYEDSKLNSQQQQARLLVAALEMSEDSLETAGVVRSVVMFLTIGSRVSAIVIHHDLEKDSIDYQQLASWNYVAEGKVSNDDGIQSFDIVQSESAKFHLILCNSIGCVGVLEAAFQDNMCGNESMDLSFTFYDAFRLESIENLILRACSIGLMASMQGAAGNGYDEIVVWTANPHPGSSEELSGLPRSDYSSSHIRSDSDNFVSFEFVHTGFLESSPAIVAFGATHVTMFSRQEGSAEWIATIQVAYQAQLQPQFSATGLHCNDPSNLNPHLVPAMLLAYSSSDERKFLCADWHPESCLTHLFADERGVEVALGRIRRLLIWLITEGKELADGYLEGPLVVAPMPIVDKELQYQSDKSTASESDTLLRKLASDLSSRCAELERPLSSGRTYTSSPVLLQNYTDSDWDLPPLLLKLSCDDLHILRACCDVLLDPPNFQSLDLCGQHFVTSVAIFGKLSKAREEKENTAAAAFHLPYPRLLVKTTSYAKDDSPESHIGVASSGCLAALLSNSQTLLLDHCKKLDQKLDWHFARELRLPFWVRSDVTIARVCEEIGQNIYRYTRDIMDSSLFFIIARKTRTLKNLAAADQSDSGRKLYKFLTTHDFSSDRGRRAAEKNAFSLLRKCKYREAAAFFLLSEPPSLNSAVETILTKLRDVDLAFLVARLVESNELGISGLPSGPGLAFGGVIGGGGGYAGAGVAGATSTSDEVTFYDWRPNLGNAAKRLLVTRTLPMSAQDCSLSAAQLIWLDKREEASWCLSGILRTAGTASETRSLSDIVEHVLSNDESMLSRGGRATKAAAKASSLIDFVSAPNLLKSLRAGSRAWLASCLVVAKALSLKGIEVPSLHTLLQSIVDDNDSGTENARAQSVQCSSPVVTGQMQSSIFDAFTAPPRQAVRGSVPVTSGQVESSIFDSFDVPRQVPTASVVSASCQMESSIFDSFNVPRSLPKAASSSATEVTSVSGKMESSIFDSYDAPQATPKVVAPPGVATASGQMESSIFDSYDAPQAPPKVAAPPAVATASGQMESSIFDSFDVPLPIPKLAQAHTVSGQVCSPNFDSSEVSRTPQTAKGFPGLSPATGSLASLSVAETEKSSQLNPGAVDFDVPEMDFHIRRMPTPELWLRWKTCLVQHTAGRRLIREIASVLAQYHGDPADPSISEFYKCDDPLVPSGASGILQLPCDSGDILGRVQQSLDDLCSLSNLKKETVVRSALLLLGPSHQQHRLLFAVVLYATIGRTDMAESTLRAASFDLMQVCNVLAFSFDNLVHRRMTKAHVSTQFLRRRAARVSWQLETCLWLHRGGGLPLSSFAIKEAIVAVRVGLLIASWNHNHECLEAMIRSDPDCQLDEDSGRHLWTSLKIIASTFSVKQLETKKTSSGGWEFLVDCRRAEATQMLRDKRTGTFIIRPHSGDNGVFTLSFKTNLVPNETIENGEDRAADSGVSGDEMSDNDVRSPATKSPMPRSKPVRKDDVVQHAIIRLSESGYRCGSFGPYTTLISLLEAVSESLPFNLRFDLPPSRGVIKEEGTQPTPNAVFLRKLALSHADSIVSNPPEPTGLPRLDSLTSEDAYGSHGKVLSGNIREKMSSFGVFLELLVMSAVRKQLSSVVTAEYEDIPSCDNDSELEEIECLSSTSSSVNEPGFAVEPQDRWAVAFRMLGPLSIWCRSLEVLAAHELAPNLKNLRETIDATPVDIADSAEAIEAAPQSGACSIDGGDALLRKMIKRGSGVEFSTLRLVDSGECTIVVIFSQKDTIQWLVSNGVEDSEASALARLQRMEKKRVIEAIDMSKIKLKHKEAGVSKKGIRYRILDPWEVEALQNWEGETLGASLGRERFLGFNLGKVGLASENVFRTLGGLPLLALWTTTKGGVVLTKALASVHPPWERAGGGDLQFSHGVVAEQPPFINSIRQHLYRNALFRRLGMPQRFLSLVQVELLDLKNLTAPGGSLSMSVYAILRLKRDGTTAALTNKARTLDTATTHPVKLGKSSGPNAPASWGSVVRFRFALPEQASVDGISFDRDRELLFKGPPTVLQVSVYEKKLLVDHSLGTADIRTDGLWSGGQLEEWVPLRSEKHGISWFARVRLTLRFELMCLATEDESKDLALAAPSVGLRRIRELCRSGGVSHEDLKRPVSSPDLLAYFESMVY